MYDMKTRKFVTALLLLTLSLIAANTRSQSRGRGTAKSPVELKGEPHHRLKFENRYVRVWDALIPAGDATSWHIHRNDNVVLTLGDASVRVEAVGSPPIETQPKLGDVGFRRATYVHRTMSIGTNAFHNMAIEILSLPRAPRNEAAITVVNSSRKPVFENDKVRVFRLSLAPGESTGMHSHPFPGLAVMITAGEIVIETPGIDKPGRATVSVGDVMWREDPTTHSIRNKGNTRFEAIDIEIKYHKARSRRRSGH